MKKLEKLPPVNQNYRNPLGPVDRVEPQGGALVHVRGLTWRFNPSRQGIRGAWCADGDGQVRVEWLTGRYFLRTEWDVLRSEDDEGDFGAPQRLANECDRALQQATSRIEVHHQELFEYLGGVRLADPRKAVQDALEEHLARERQRG